MTSQQPPRLELRAGMKIILPNGNMLRLIECGNREWLCEYLPGSKARGEVAFSARFLRRYARPL